MSFIAKIISFFITGIRPFLGPADCKFYPSCTRFAQQQLEQQPLHKALWIITKRVASCNPFTKNI